MRRRRRYRIVHCRYMDQSWYELEVRRLFRWRPCDDKGYEEMETIGAHRFMLLSEAQAAISDIAIERRVVEHWVTIRKYPLPIRAATEL